MFTMITKSDCEWCDKAKELIASKGEKVTAYDYKEHPTIVLLMKKSWLKTVPQIWAETPIGKEYIGGYEDLVDWFNERKTDIDWLD